MDKDLTPKQKLVLDYIKKFRRKNGHAPTQEAIAKGLGFRSVGTINYHLQGLKELGYLEETEKNAKYGIQLKEGARGIPLLGKVAAGSPIDYRYSNESLELPPYLLPPSGKDCFVLEAQGNSMVDAHILNGDYLLIKKQHDADNGQIVVAEIDNEATIKRYFKKRNHIELHPENREYDIIKVPKTKDFRIEGVLISVLSRRD